MISSYSKENLLLLGSRFLFANIMLNPVPGDDPELWPFCIWRDHERSQDFGSGTHFWGPASWGSGGGAPRTPENFRKFSKFSEEN